MHTEHAETPACRAILLVFLFQLPEERQKRKEWWGAVWNKKEGLFTFVCVASFHVQLLLEGLIWSILPHLLICNLLLLIQVANRGVDKRGREQLEIALIAMLDDGGRFL